MIYLELFLGFLNVGCFAFGGAYGAIPLIRDVVMSYGWLNDETLSYMIAVSESTPGPIMVNLATYIGSSQAGFWGAVIATTAVVLPSFLIILLIATSFADFKDNNIVAAAFKGMRPAVVALIAAPIINMAKGMSWWKIVLALAVSVIIWQLGVSPIWFIFAGALAGLLWSFRPEMNDKDGKEGER